MTRCVSCGTAIAGPCLDAGDAGTGLHPECLAERLPHDAAVALIAATALFLIPCIRVWSA
jgi:hypothetical protein